jgi:putative Ca2+/H+ antiporter (TMEM165/GDT1 family)
MAALVASFLVVALAEMGRAQAPAERRGWGPLLTTTVVFFLAEMGDKTQLATAALGARYASTLAVTLGTTAGMLAADALAVFAGHRFAAIVPLVLLRRLAAALFFLFGIASIVAAEWRSG